VFGRAFAGLLRQLLGAKLACWSSPGDGVACPVTRITAIPRLVFVEIPSAAHHATTQVNPTSPLPSLQPPNLATLAAPKYP
jgi:hypothetical protein